MLFLMLAMGTPGVFPSFLNKCSCVVSLFWFVLFFLFCFCAYVTLLSTRLEMENTSWSSLHKIPVSSLTVSGCLWSTLAHCSEQKGALAGCCSDHAVPLVSLQQHSRALHQVSYTPI